MKLKEYVKALKYYINDNSDYILGIREFPQTWGKAKMRAVYYYNLRDDK